MKPLSNTLAAARVSAFAALIFFLGCGSTPKNQVNAVLTTEMPSKFLWAWERPEDLRFVDPKEFGVAFLAQTIFLDNTGVTPKPRRQPLEIAPETYLIAVTRIETDKNGHRRPSFDTEMQTKVVSLIRNTLELPNVRGVQIDFDAVVSERNFYRSMMFKLREKLDTSGGNTSVNEPATMPDAHRSLTMTSLASWCTGDAWFNDFPVDEAVPMAFQMGADSEKIKNYLRNGNDWNEPLCRGSYGISLEEGLFDGMKEGRRIYYFKNSPWTKSDANKLQ